jgi:cell division protein FtsB
MLDFTRKKKTRKFMYSIPVLVFLFVIFVFLASRAFILYQKESEVRHKAEEVRANLAELEMRKNELRKKVGFLRTEGRRKK